MTRALTKATKRATEAVTQETAPFRSEGRAGPDRRHIARVLDIMESLWGRERGLAREDHHLGDPLEGLVLTILSQNTNDRNRDRGFAGMKARFDSWDAVAEASREDLAEAIRPAGISNNKAKSILSVLQLIKERFGIYSLEEMRGWSPQEARAYLEELPGVGPKTAACVLVFDLDMPAFPADTHVTRVCKRLGWAPASFTPAQIQHLMEEFVAPARYQGAHLNLIEHGRHICRSRKPDCGNCPAQAMCNFGRSVEEGSQG